MNCIDAVNKRSDTRANGRMPTTHPKQDTTRSYVNMRQAKERRAKGRSLLVTGCRSTTCFSLHVINNVSTGQMYEYLDVKGETQRGVTMKNLQQKNMHQASTVQRQENRKRTCEEWSTDTAGRSLQNTYSTYRKPKTIQANKPTRK